MIRCKRDEGKQKVRRGEAISPHIVNNSVGNLTSFGLSLSILFNRGVPLSAIVYNDIVVLVIGLCILIT